MHNYEPCQKERVTPVIPCPQCIANVQVKMAELEILPAGAASLAAGCAAFLPLPQAAQEHE